MTVKFFWRCESEVLDGSHDYSAGATTLVSNDGASFSASAMRIGTNGLLCTNASDWYECASTSIVTLDEGSFGLWIQARTSWFTSGQAAGFQIVEDGDTNDTISLQGSSTDEFRLNIRQSGGSQLTLTTTSANLAINNWYFVVCRWHLSQDKRRIEVYNTSLTLIQGVQDLATDLSGGIPGALDQLRIGNSARTDPTWIDNVMISDDYDELLQDFAEYTTYTQFLTGGPLVMPTYFQRPNVLLRM